MHLRKEIVFKSLFTTHYQQLCRFAYRFVYDIEAAREVVQEAFTILWEKGELTRSEESLKSFLYATVKNSSINYLQRVSIHNRYRNKILLEYAKEADGYFDLIEEKELKEKIDAVVTSLPEQCRKIFIMNRYKGLKYREIAEALGISIKAVEAQVSKALYRIKHELSDYFPLALLLTIYQLY